MSYKIRPQQFSFHLTNTNNNNLKQPNYREIKSKSIITAKNLADLNADELFEKFDEFFEVKTNESFNPDTYRVDTHRTIIKDLTRKFNDIQCVSEPDAKYRMQIQNFNEKKIKREKKLPEYYQAKLTKNQNFNDSKTSLNATSFTKRYEDYSNETRNKSFHIIKNQVKAKIPQNNASFLLTVENKENIPYNNSNISYNKINNNQEKIDNRSKEQKNKQFNHRRVETYCDIINSMDDESLKKKFKYCPISSLIAPKDEIRQLMNKSVIESKVICNEKKKSTHINSYENVGRLLKLLKQDAEKRINIKKNDELNLTSTSFLKAQNNYKMLIKEKNLKRSISSGISRK